MTTDPPLPEVDATLLKQQALGLLNGGGDARVAYRLLTQAVESSPDADSLVRMAHLEIANPLWRQRALDHLKQAIEIDPRLTSAWLGLGNYWSLRGEPGKQRRCLEKILAYDPNNRDARQTLDLLR
jgi:tetratricopeptide (TPR) repeat protein